MIFLDLNNQYKKIEKEINKAIGKIFKNGVFIGGEEVEQFEKEFAKFCNAKHAISVNSGTDALFLSLKALDIKEGDEVITTPFTFIATAETIINCKAKPVFVDIDLNTFNIDASKIEKAITKNTKAIMPVHLFGQMADMGEIVKIAKKYNLYIIEDAAQAVGAKYKNNMAGTIGNLGCFSFFPSKNLGGYGDGGMIVTNNGKLFEKLRLLRNHGSSPKEKYLNLTIGMNSRLDSLQAAILRVKLKHLLKWNKERKKRADYYNQSLKKIKEIILPKIKEENVHVFNQYTIKIKKREDFKKYLQKIGIPTNVYYPLPLHLQPALKYLGYKKGDFPVAEEISKEVISLPVYPELSKKDQDSVIKEIKRFYGK
ncbi:MAG: DegT/DnrJ/EryC1/StrS family aminotransferase [Candidatus Pacebacteria bacterium]|nr:DegT/DnrJ/EryC1/StrS family aminotransferase [Candidatus Paceibacterota bacterium]